jgi:hypothetical protein
LLIFAVGKLILASHNKLKIMKKFFIFLIAIVFLVLKISAQVDHDYNPKDITPSLGEPLTLDNIPTAVLKTFHTDFTRPGKQTWYSFPYPLKEYGWVYDKDAKDVQPDQYEVVVEMENETVWSAVYSAAGTLLATRDEYKNSEIPASVKEALENSKYKNWTIVGNIEIINYYYDRKNFDKHFRLTVEKNNVRRSISFNFKTEKISY